MLVIFFVLDKLISDPVFSSISQLKVCRFQLISILRVNTLLTSNSTLLSRYFQPTAMLRYFRHMNTRFYRYLYKPLFIQSTNRNSWNETNFFTFTEIITLHHENYSLFGLIRRKRGKRGGKNRQLFLTQLTSLHTSTLLLFANFAQNNTRIKEEAVHYGPSAVPSPSFNAQAWLTLLHCRGRILLGTLTHLHRRIYAQERGREGERERKNG